VASFMGDEKAQFVHENATVIVGNDPVAGTTVIFVVKSNGAVAYYFPMAFGEGRALTAAEVELFLLNTEKSEMLDAIRVAWKKRQGQ
jgi:hypothetical protein